MKNLTPAQPLEGEHYWRFLESIRVISTSGSLTVRPEMHLSHEGTALLEIITTRVDLTSEWPGTRLLGMTAKVHHFPVDSAVIARLREATSSIFAWKQPERPEDLAFYREDGSTLFGSIAHEGDLFFNLSDPEVEQLSMVGISLLQED